MAVVSSWDGANRLIYIASGVTAFHPIDDIYREYRTARRLDESLRVWEPFMVAVGNDAKGGGKFTSRYLLLLDMHIVPFDAAGTLAVTGEVLVDDQSDPFDISSLTNPMVVKYQPPDTELVEITGSGLTTPEAADLSLARKMLTNRHELADGSSGNLITYDDDDSILLTQDVSDENDNAISLGVGDPAKVSKGV